MLRKEHILLFIQEIPLSSIIYLHNYETTNLVIESNHYEMYEVRANKNVYLLVKQFIIYITLSVYIWKVAERQTASLLKYLF